MNDEDYERMNEIRDEYGGDPHEGESDADEGYCPTCCGSGEGRYEGTNCYACGGTGESK